MGGRYWLWVVARLVVALVIVGWAVSYLGTGSGEKEFQKTLEAMKQVHSFRVASTSSYGTQHSEMLWEVDCGRNMVHHQWHHVESSTNPPTEMNRDETFVGGMEYDRKSDGSWAQNRYAYQGNSAKFVCSNLTQGADTNLLPQIATMIRRGVIQKGPKKTVNGVRCREWHVTLKGGSRGLEHDSVCLGLDDHLPYELIAESEGSRSSYTDYNTALQIDVPEAAVQPASTTN